MARGKLTPYTTREVVQKLAAEKLTYRDIAKQLAIPKSTAHRWGRKVRD